MAPSTTLYRFRIDLSDVDRGLYQQLDFRIAQHPSENDLFMLTRMLAYCLNSQEGLEFSSAGLSDPDGPCLMINHPNGRTLLWIEVGNPSSRKLHKASKAADTVKVYTYKNPELILREAKSQDIHRADQIQIFAFDPHFLERLSKHLVKDVRWNVLVNDNVLTVGTTGTRATVVEQCDVRRLEIKDERV